MKIDFSTWGLSNQRLVLLFVIILTLGGVAAYYSMPKLEDPEITVRQAVVVGIYPGASAHQVELELTAPMENSIRKSGHILFTQSNSYADMCYIMVVQDVDVPDDQLQANWQLMRNHLAAASLPAGAQVMVHDDFGEVSGLFYALKSNGVDDERLQSFAEMIRRELQKVEGVSHVNIYGTRDKRVNIALRQDRLATMDITPAEVMAAIGGQDATAYAGYYLNGNNRIRVAVDDRYRSLDDIRSLVLRGHRGDMFRLSDIAEVSMEPERPVRAEMQRDGQPALGLLISASSGTDIVKVGAHVEEKMAELRATRLPASIECEKVFFQSDRVKDAMLTFILNLVESVLLVILLLMFTMNFRSGLILGVTLVVTVLGTVFILDKTGGALQRVSLGSFILAMGMLVDNAIVIVDGILIGRQKGLPRHEALTSIGRQTALPLLGATLIAILAFLPIFLSPDATGLYVHDMFIVLAVSLLLSWVLALVLVPMMGARWLCPKDTAPHDSPTPHDSPAPQLYASRPHQWLTATLRHALAHRWLTVGLMVLLLAVCGLCYPLMPRELFPNMKYDQFYMEYKLPENSDPARVKADLDSIRNSLMAMPGVSHVTTSIGTTPGRYNLVRSVSLPMLSYGELIVDVTSADDLNRRLDSLQHHFAAKYPDAFLVFKRYNLMFMRYPIELSFCGPDPAVLHQLADSAMNVVNQLNIMDPVTTDWAPQVPTLVASYDQPQARRKGVTRSEVALSLLSATDGMPISRYYDGTVSHNIYVTTTDQQGAPLSDLSNTTVSTLLPHLQTTQGQAGLASLLAAQPSLRLSHATQLRELGDAVSVQWEYPVIPHYNGERIHSIFGYPVKGLLAEDARAQLADVVDNWQLPEGYSIHWGGEKYASDLSMKNLFSNYPLVVLLMLAILVAITRRFRTSLLLFLCIPFVFVGIIPVILLTGSSFNFVAIVGTLGLVGMMLKNGIVLIDEIRLQMTAGNNPTQAIVDASKSRLRPVTLASLTTVLGMVPLLFDDMFSAMAATIMGGLMAGTVIVLVFIPVLYSLFFFHADGRSRGKYL